MSNTRIHTADGYVLDVDMQPYCKKPVVVWAVRMDEPFDVKTPEGTMHGNAGDYLIRGIKGEWYPCKPDIFAETYEFVGYSQTQREVDRYYREDTEAQAVT